MRDAYENLFKHIDKNIFTTICIEDIIYIENQLIDENWEKLKYDVFNNNTIYIRGYGRDAKKTDYYLSLYKFLFDNNNVIKDSTNNAQPTKLLKNNTKYCKVTKDNKNGKIRISNYQVSHLFGRTKNPLLFNCGWNIAYIPKYLDPFTGHETQGDFSLRFKELFLENIRTKFSKYIMDYNSIIENHVTNKLDESLLKVKKKHRINAKNFNRFQKDAKKELSTIDF